MTPQQLHDTIQELYMLKNNLAVLQQNLHPEKGVVKEEATEAYLWDAIQALDNAINVLQPNPYI
jgi:hypothetical protein